MARTNSYIIKSSVLVKPRDKSIASFSHKVDFQSCAIMDEGDSKVVEKLDVEDEESRHSRIRMLAFKHPAKKC